METLWSFCHDAFSAEPQKVKKFSQSTENIFRGTLMRIFLSLILLASPVFSAELLNVGGKVMMVDFTSKRVELDVPANRGIEADSRVCLQGRGEVKQSLDLKCGKILSVADRTVLVEITKGGLTFQLGEVVNVITENKAPVEQRMIASYYDNLTGQAPARSGVAAGMSFGFNYFFPSVHLEYAVSHQVTLGVLGLLGDSQSNNRRSKTYGGLLGLTVYTPQPTLGLHFEFLVGAYNSTVTIATIEESTSSIVGAGLVGWKGFLSDQIHYRVSGGAQYVANQKRTQLLDFSSVLPFFRAEVGFSL